MPQKTLHITGYRGSPVPNALIEQKEPQSTHISLIFPGLNYNASMPGLYYPGLVMKSKRADLLHINYNYTSQDFQSLTATEQYQWITIDATAACQAAATYKDYTQITLIGKSLGTLALGHLLTTETCQTRVNFIWLTPLLRNDQLIQQIISKQHRGLFIIGTADPHYEPTIITKVKDAIECQFAILDNANHGLEVAGNPLGSVHIMEHIVQKIDAFVDQDDST